MNTKNSGPSFFYIWLASAMAGAKSIGPALVVLARHLGKRVAVLASVAAIGFVAYWTLPWVGSFGGRLYAIKALDKPKVTDQQWALVLGDQAGKAGEDDVKCAVEAFERKTATGAMFLPQKCAEKLMYRAMSVESRYLVHELATRPVAAPTQEELQEMERRLDQRMGFLLGQRLRQGEDVSQAAKSALAQVQKEEARERADMAAQKKQELAWKSERQANLGSDPEIKEGRLRWEASQAVLRALKEGRDVEVSRALSRKAMEPVALWSEDWAQTPEGLAARSPDRVWFARFGGLALLITLAACALLARLTWQFVRPLLAAVVGQVQAATQARRETLFPAWEAKQVGGQAKKTKIRSRRRRL